MYHMSNKNRSQGFTIVELIVVISVLSILIGLIATTLLNFYLSNIATINRTTQANDVASTLQSIEKNVSLASNFLSKTSGSALATPLGPENSAMPWIFKTGEPNYNVLIVQNYATDGTSSDTARKLIYSSADCKSDPVKNTLIYFVDSSSTLYRRTISGSPSVCGGTISQKTTCAPTATSSPLCIGVDAVLSRNVSKFQIHYFANSSDQTPVDPYSQSEVTAADTIRNAKAINITLETSENINGKLNKYASTLRITRLNE